MYKIIHFLVLLLMFVGGIVAGSKYQQRQQASKPTMLPDFYDNKASFCELNEEDRLTICPNREVVQQDGATNKLVIYYCSNKVNYVVFHNFNEKDKKLALSTPGYVFEFECKTKTTEAYEVTRR